MTLPWSVAVVLSHHAAFEVKDIDRMYIYLGQPRQQTDSRVAAFVRLHRSETFAATAFMDPIRKTLVTAVEHVVNQQQIPVITFAKGQCKDDVVEEHHANFAGTDGTVYLGKAQ